MHINGSDNMSVLKPLADLVQIDMNETFKAELVVASNLMFKGSLFKAEELQGPFALHGVTKKMETMKSALPNVYTLFAAALTFGGSTASCEASFSTMTRVLTPYRRSMAHQRKENLIILSHEHELTKKIEKKALMQRFNARCSRRLRLF